MKIVRHASPQDFVQHVKMGTCFRITSARFRARKGISLTHIIRNVFRNAEKGISWSLMSLYAKNANLSAHLAQVSMFALNALLVTFSPIVIVSRHVIKTRPILTLPQTNAKGVKIHARHARSSVPIVLHVFKVIFSMEGALLNALFHIFPHFNLLLRRALFAPQIVNLAQ